MKLRLFPGTFLSAVLLGGMAATALPQIPVPVPFPGLEIQFTPSRPPAPRYERRPERPGHEYTWGGGQWYWDGGRWTWSTGRWERPEVPDVYWITPRYIRTRRGYIYEPGHWSNQTVVVGDDVRGRAEWRRHEREHERELERERDRKRYRDRYRR